MPTNKYATPGPFLDAISQIESSGGKNMDHPMLQHGLQQGTSAMGKYALMPNTVKEIINRRRQAGTMTTDLSDLDQMSPQDMKTKIEGDPELEDELAKSLAVRVLQRQLGDEDKAAYSWTMGHNLSPHDIPDDKLNDMSSKGGQYVDKFRRIKDQMNQQPPVDQEQQDSGDDDGDL
jgi:hypothetical protein